MPGEEEGLDPRTLEYFEQIQHSAGESDRGLVIFTTSQIDFYLRRILETFLIDDKSVEELFDGAFAPFSSLSGKTAAAYLMGLISKREKRCIDAIRKVRNVFAHDLKASFEHERVKKICSQPPIYDGRLCDRDAFLHKAMNIIPPLIYRDARIRREWKRSELTDDVANSSPE
jgi:hypothetical protein